MFHLDNTSGVPEMPEPKEQQSITPKWFGESVEQGGISWPGADWFNIIQAELLNTLSAAGIPPEKNAFNQLSKAIPVLGDAVIRKDLGSEAIELGDALSVVKQPFKGAGARRQHSYNSERFSFFDIPDATIDCFNPFTDFDDKARAAAVENRAVYYGANQLVAPRMGFKSWRYFDGTHDRSCIISVRNTLSPGDMGEPSTQSFGAESLATLSRYSNRDGVGIYCHIVAPPELWKSTNTTFTSTSVTCPDLTDEILNQLRHRMVVDVNDANGKWWTSFLVGVDKATRTLTIQDGWALMGSAAETLGTPVSGATLRIAAITKVWAGNFLVSVNEASRATAMAGFELGMYNSKAAISGVGYGYDMFSGGLYPIENGYQSRGLYTTGFNAKSTDASRAFASTGQVPYAFYSNGDTRGLFVTENLYGIIVNNSKSYAMQIQTDGAFITGMDSAGRWQSLKLHQSTTAVGATISNFAVVTYVSPAANADTFAMPPHSLGKVITVKNFSSAFSALLTGVFEKAATTFSLPASASVTFTSDGTYWYPISSYSPAK